MKWLVWNELNLSQISVDQRQLNINKLYINTNININSKLHLRHSGFTYSPYGLFTKHLERTKKFKGTSDLKYIYKNKLYKAYFAYSDSKYLAKRTISDAK